MWRKKLVHSHFVFLDYLFYNVVRILTVSVSNCRKTVTILFNLEAIYLTTLAVTPYIQSRTIKLLTNSELERIRKKNSHVLISDTVHAFSRRYWQKPTSNHDSQAPDRDLNPVPPAYGVLTIGLQRSVHPRQPWHQLRHKGQRSDRGERARVATFTVLFQTLEVRGCAAAARIMNCVWTTCCAVSAWSNARCRPVFCDRPAATRFHACRQLL
jgi:hypothetical protein